MGVHCFKSKDNNDTIKSAKKGDSRKFLTKIQRIQQYAEQNVKRKLVNTE